MADIRLSTVSRRDITDPVITQFVDEVAGSLQAGVLQALSAQANPAWTAFRPGQVTAGIKVPKNYDSVAKVVIDKWYPHLTGPKQQAALRAAPRANLADPRLQRSIRNRQIDLRAAKPVLEQLTLGRHFVHLDIERILDRLNQRFDEFALPADNITTANAELLFRINRVSCIDETDPEFLGADTIAMGGTALDHRERATEIDQFTVGDFDDGDQVVYNSPKVLKTFNLAGGTYPKLFTVFLALAEKDAGGFGDFLTALYEAVKAEVVIIISTLSVAAGSAIGAAIGGSTGAALGGPIGAAIGIIAGLILGALVAWLANIAQDDLFGLQIAFVELPSATATFPGGALTSPLLRFDYADFGGRYRVRYSWQLKPS